MSEISETEIKTMTKEQNYMRGYKDGKSDVLDKIRAEIYLLSDSRCDGTTITIYSWNGMKRRVLEIIDKYKEESEDNE